MKTLNESELENIVGGTALPEFFDNFRTANGKIFFARGTVQNGQFVPARGTQPGTIRSAFDSVEGFMQMLQVQKRSGNTHLALGEQGSVYSVDELIESLSGK